jgi:hypothetical protein
MTEDVNSTSSPAFFEAKYQNKKTLRNAIDGTFKNRNTEIDKEPIALSTVFGNDPTKQVQWAAF